MPSPILIIPGIGGSILVKKGLEKKRIFKETVIDNRWMNISPLSSQRMTLWRNDHAAILRRNLSGLPTGIEQVEGDIHTYPGVQGICNIVPEFELLARPYQDLLNMKFNYKYFGNFVDTAIATNSYVPDDNLKALPYDFRRVLDPEFRQSLFSQMRDMVEEMYRQNNGPVVIVGHSLGAVLFKWFLTVHVNGNWAKKYVKRFFVVNAPFGGSNTALKAIMSGEYFVPIFSKQFHSSLQLNSGIIMCFPNTYGYIESEILAHVDKQPVTLESLATPMCHTTGDAYDIWRSLYVPHQDTIMDPVIVPTHVVTCTPTLETLKTFKLQKIGGGDVEDVVVEPGDGQVSARSLNVAYDLFESSTMMRTTIDGCHHINITSDPRFIELVLKEARN